MSPTQLFHSPDRLRYALSFDDQTPQVVDLVLPDTSVPTWRDGRENNINTTITSHDVGAAGDHLLKYWMVDSGVVLQKLVIDTGGVKPSYLGPPESYASPPDGTGGSSGTGGAGTGGATGTGGSSGTGGMAGTGGAIARESCTAARACRSPTSPTTRRRSSRSTFRRPPT